VLELDERLQRLQAQMREWSGEVHRLALEVDASPENIEKLIELPALRYLATLLIPADRQPSPLRLGPHVYDGTRCIERVVAIEELASADAAAVLAAPGPSLSGVIVAQLADEEQKEWYYQRLLSAPRWTFFALTEPAQGSNAGQLTTRLHRDGDAWRLTGAKRYVGGAARADLGVVVARRSGGPLGVTAVLVETSEPGFAAVPLPTVGLRAAGLSAITLREVPVSEDRFLGRHLPATARGMNAVTRTFHQFRPGVAAMALGVARAAHKYVTDHRRTLRVAERHRLDELAARIHTVRRLVRLAAARVDADPTDGALGSVAKVRAVALAEQATALAPRFFGPGARLDHPLLDKLARDALGLEFMEGTSHMQKLSYVQSHLKGRLIGV